MAQPVLLPKLGQTVEVATIVKWHKQVGDTVKQGDVLFEIETDKAVLEAESFFNGTLIKILVGTDQPTPVSSVVAYIGEKGEKAPDGAPPPPPATKPEPTPASAAVTPPPQAEPEGRASRPGEPPPAPQILSPPPAPAIATPVAPVPPTATRLFISPRARALAKARCIDPSRITGRGANGRIVTKDIEAYLEAAGYNNLRISPAAKHLAAREGIDILTVRPTGAAGRIMVEDVKRSLAARPRKMSKMRQTIASRLSSSFRDIPHFYVTVAVDMTGLLQYRQELKELGQAYKVTDFILEAVVLALGEFPALNSTTDGLNMRWNESIHLGLAVGLDDGLVVPPIRHAQDLSLTELSAQAALLAGKARDGKLMPDEMTGSTFTVTNMGMFNVDNFGAIINPGEGGILAVASTLPTPVVREGQVVVRQIMKLTLSVDHRIVDGTTGANFVNAVKAKLEDLDLWKHLT